MREGALLAWALWGLSVRRRLKLQKKRSDLSNRFQTNYRSKQAAHNRNNKFVTILSSWCYWSICTKFARVALVGVLSHCNTWSVFWMQAFVTNVTLSLSCESYSVLKDFLNVTMKVNVPSSNFVILLWLQNSFSNDYHCCLLCLFIYRHWFWWAFHAVGSHSSWKWWAISSSVECWKNFDKSLSFLWSITQI